MSAEIQDLVRQLNRCWLDGRFDDLGAFFHKDAVLASPDAGVRLSGRDGCVNSYREFLAQAVVHDFELLDAEVDVFGSTAVAACPYTMEYEMGGKRWASSGRDLLVLTREGERWLVVWRTLLAGSDEEVAEGRAARGESGT